MYTYKQTVPEQPQTPDSILVPFLNSLLHHQLATKSRYSRVRTIRSQSVSEHSFNVAILAAILVREANHSIAGDLDESYIEETKVLRYALFHDLSESVTGDVDYHYKRSVHYKPEGEQQYFEECLVNCPAYHSVRQDCLDFESDSSHEANLVRLVDMLDVALYSAEELMLGNKNALPIFKFAVHSLHDTAEWKSFFQWCPTLNWIVTQFQQFLTTCGGDDSLPTENDSGR